MKNQEEEIKANLFESNQNVGEGIRIGGQSLAGESIPIEQQPQIQTMNDIFKDFENIKFPEEEEFIYTKFSFSGHPIGLKKKLIQITGYCNTIGRAAKKFYNGRICTILECFSTKTNLHWLLTSLIELSELQNLNINLESEIPIILKLEFLKKQPAEIQEFLLSESEKSIEDTPYYMRRPNGHGRSSDRQNVTIGNKNLDVALQMKFYVLPQIYTDLKKLIINVEDKFTRNKSPSSFTPREETQQIECCFMDDPKTKYFFMHIYPTEPPTMVFPKIKAMFPEFTYEDIILFDENGKKLDHTLEIQEIKSRKLLFYFNPLVASFEQKNPKVGSIMREFKLFYELCFLSIRNADIDMLKVITKDGVEDWFKNDKVSQKIFQVRIANY